MSYVNIREVPYDRSSTPMRAPASSPTTGPQFIAKDFKEFVRICGMTHVKTSPYYPQSNGNRTVAPPKAQR